jgi:predicted metal-dependent hydrolase
VERTPRRRTPARAPRLFEPRELELRATGEARFRKLAATPERPPTVREAHAEEERAVMERLLEHARDLGRRFKLRYKAIEAEQDGIFEHYGVCYEDGVIRIRLRHAVTGRLLKESSLVDTLCHELAHLRYFDHGERFRTFYRRILDEARRLGYYRPGSNKNAGPRQGDLFEGCGLTTIDSHDGDDRP